MERKNLMLDLITEIREMNKNIVSLVERDKVQNKRLDNLESDLKEVKNLLQHNTLNIHRFIGAISILGVIVPILLRHLGVM